jgi:hypothetical protein
MGGGQKKVRGDKKPRLWKIECYEKSKRDCRPQSLKEFQGASKS